MSRELWIYCDESDQSGRLFSNFYGGLLVESHHLLEVEARITAARRAAGLDAEVKWQKISEAYASRYMALMDEVFNLASEGKLKLRVMFSQNINAPPRLTPQQREDGFFLLYYQFIKWTFGLQHAGQRDAPTRVRLMFDKLPDSREKAQRFKGYLSGLGKSPDFRRAGIQIDMEAISEVDSKHHILLQCVDVVLGSMQFRLNRKHEDKPEGSRVRGKRTIAKELVYNHINRRIRELRPNFNIGVSTSDDGDTSNRWAHPYRHWLFKPNAQK